jgi:hypothetical protein
MFFQATRLDEIFHLMEKHSVRLESSSAPEIPVRWLCKNCYDVGEIVVKT